MTDSEGEERTPVHAHFTYGTLIIVDNALKRMDHVLHLVEYVLGLSAKFQKLLAS